VHPGNLAGEFFDLEMTWILYCAGAATVTEWITNAIMPYTKEKLEKYRKY